MTEARIAVRAHGCAVCKKWAIQRGHVYVNYVHVPYPKAPVRKWKQAKVCASCWNGRKIDVTKPRVMDPCP